MGDYHRDRGSGGGRGGGGGGGHRKRRYREDDDHQDRRGPGHGPGSSQRRRYEEPMLVRVRKQLKGIAESPVKRVEDEVASLAKTIADNYFDEELQNEIYDLLLQIVLEQPFKIPFAAAIVLIANTHRKEVAQEILTRAGVLAQKHLDAGSWRELKLLLRFLGLLQGLFEGEGVFPVLEDLFSRAVDLQTASSEDALGLELVKIILLTIPYIMSSSATGADGPARALLEKTDIIASTPHALEALVDPYPGEGDNKPRESPSVIALLQKQLQDESTREWPVACIPRPWKMPAKEDGSDDPLATATKHAFPKLVVPDPIQQPTKPMFPELYFSVYADQDVETVPSTKDVASCLLRDAMVDTINTLDFNRHATAKFLADVDCYFAPGTFVKRATPFDKLKEMAGDGSTWKPEDVAVDAVFSQMFQLPMPTHKLVYYHSVLTESCKIAPAAVAPSLGRAIRFSYRNIDSVDLELAYRFIDWFSHHLSNFGFTWKWTEWVDDVALSDLQPKKAFIVAALDKEIRLSFAQRIKGTLPEPYQELISVGKEKDTPDFKFDAEDAPFREEAQTVKQAIRKREPDEAMQAHLEAIREQAEKQGLAEPLLIVTDILMTCICAVGSKSLSHMLSCIERCKERLLSLGGQSESTRKHIITSVLAYWHDHPGVGVNIIDKLLNYTVLTPLSIVEWALVEHHEGGAALARAWVYEMVSMTVIKVSSRVHQLVHARCQPDLLRDQFLILDETLRNERVEQSKLFGVIEDALLGFTTGQKDEMNEAGENNNDGTSPEAGLIRDWAARWLRVFRRKAAVEEAVMTTISTTEELLAAIESNEKNEGEGEGEGQSTEVPSNGMEGVDVDVGNGDGDAAKNTGVEQAAPEGEAEALTPEW